MNQALHVSELDFGSSIMGFETLRRFQLAKVEGDNPFFILRSKEEHSIEFVGISPFEAYKEYEVELPEELKRELEVEDAQDVMVLCIANLKKPFEQSTLNLLAPLVINVRNGTARQFIMNGSGYSAKAQLLPNQSGGR